MAADRHIRQTIVAVATQTSGWGNAIANDGTFQIVNAIAGTIRVEPTVTSNQFNYYAAAGIMDSQTRKYIESTTGLKTISYDFIVNLNTVAPHFAGAFLESTEDLIIAPKLKTYTPVDTVVDFASLTDPTSDDTALHTIAISNIAASDGIKLEDAIVESLTITADNTASGTDMLWRGSVTWIGRVMTDSVNLSGATFTALPTADYIKSGDCTLNMTIGATDLSDTCWRRFTFNYNNNTAPDCMTTDGKAGQYKIAPEITIEVDIPYNTTSFAVLDNYVDGDNIAFDFGNGNPAATEAGKFDFEYGELTASPYEYEGDYHAIRVSARMLSNAGSWNAAAFSHADGTTWNYK